MAPSATLERVRKLEERGVIQGYELRLDPKKLGLGVTAFVFVKAKEKPGEIDTGERLAQHPNMKKSTRLPIPGDDRVAVSV